MHTKDLARSLRAFADIADFSRSQDLYCFAAFLDQGRNETIAARLKHLVPSTSYPLLLKESLTAIIVGLHAAGAIKLSGTVGTLLQLFSGKPGADIETFLAAISAAAEAPNLSSTHLKADKELANRIAAKLKGSDGNFQSAQGRLTEFSAIAEIRSATWTLIAYQVIGTRRMYRDRKAAINAIRRHLDSLAAHPPKENGSISRPDVDEERQQH